jgi:hypothetical protein
LVAVTMWLAGFRIHLLGNPFGPTIQLELLSLPLTTFWIVGVVNALNLIDGLDGLASGIGLFACIVLFGVAFADHAALLCLIAVSLSGALIGFLFFNSNPARIFLGDSGSMFLGFVLASVSIWTQRKGATAVALLIPVMALGVPILDTTLSVVRRLARRQNPFHADRDHIHHRLLALGLSHRHAVFTLYTLSGVFGLGALAMLKNDTTTRTIVLSTVALAVFVVVRKIGIVPPPSLFSGAFGSIRDQARASGRAIRHASSPDGAWQEVLRFLQHTTPEEVRLAWSLPVDDSQRRESVFQWRADNSKNWVLPGSSPNDDRVLRFILVEGDDSFGELVVLHQRRHRLTLEEQVAFQLVRDALIDFCIEQAPRKQRGTVVHLARDVAAR